MSLEEKTKTKTIGRKSNRDRTFGKFLISPAIMASGNSTNFLSSDSIELCDRLKLLLQEKQAGNNSDIFNKETFSIVDKLSEYKCISTKQQANFD